MSTNERRRVRMVLVEDSRLTFYGRAHWLKKGGKRKRTSVTD